MSDELRYYRAVMRLEWVLEALRDGAFKARVPAYLIEDGDPQRTAIADVTHALVNVPVEYARYHWGWSQTKTKVFAGLAVIAAFTIVHYVRSFFGG